MSPAHFAYFMILSTRKKQIVLTQADGFDQSQHMLQEHFITKLDTNIVGDPHYGKS